jgi:hypothetical protein
VGQTKPTALSLTEVSRRFTSPLGPWKSSAKWARGPGVYLCIVEATSWYCPDTGETVQTTRRRLFLTYDDQGHRVIRLAEPTLSSDMSFLFGAFVGISLTAALLFVSGYFVIRGKNTPAVLTGYGLAVIGFVFPVYYGTAKILLGRKCTRKSQKSPGVMPPLPYRLGWVMAAQGAGLVTGATVVIVVAVFLITSGTTSYLY